VGIFRRPFASSAFARVAQTGPASRIYELLNNGELSSVVIGRRRFIPAGVITAFIATTSTNTAPV
jgi:hypothetical protein